MDHKDIVQRYNEELGRLESPHKKKIEEFIKHGCIRQIDSSRWMCDPILGYNKTTYRLERIPGTAEFSCSCQGFKVNHNCSHKEALYLIFRARGEKLEPALF